jgi:hypothetical protein
VTAADHHRAPAYDAAAFISFWPQHREDQVDALDLAKPPLRFDSGPADEEVQA